MTYEQPTAVCRSIVRIDGATGARAGYINGFYEPIEEMLGRASVYRKLGETDTWIEYIESSGKWFVKPTSDRGKASGWARVIVSPPRPLEECPLSCWEVSLGGTNWGNQSTLTVSTTTMAAFEAFEAAKVIYMIVESI